MDQHCCSSQLHIVDAQPTQLYVPVHHYIMWLHQHVLVQPALHAGGDGGLHMLGGHNGGPPGGPSPPMQTPMLGGPLGSGIDGMMDLQQVGTTVLCS